MKYGTRLFWFIVFIFVTAYTAMSETAVIVHPDNDNAFDREEVTSIFLDKTKRYSNGETAHPVNLTSDAIARKEFESHFMNMDEGRLKRYWAQQLFSGRGVRPHELDRDEAVKGWVSVNKSGIGYVDFSVVDESVKVIYTIQVFSGR